MLTTKNWYAGVDIGGTTVKMAFLTPSGEFVAKWGIPTDCDHQGENIPKDIAKAIDKKLQELGESKSKLKGIGAGAPGFFNFDKGIVRKSGNIGWVDYPLKDLLEQETGLPVIVENDANLAALGEMWKGAGGGVVDLLCVTLGTGVGGGLISCGNILHGIGGFAGEIGHMISVPMDGAPCTCGKNGCLETIASATGICRIAANEVSSYPDSLLYNNNEITAKDVFKAAHKQDVFALKVIDEVSFHLGLALANLADAFNPGKIVIGGGVSKAGDTLLRPVERYFNKFAHTLVAESTEFSIASLGNDAGVIGGAWLAKSMVIA